MDETQDYFSHTIQYVQSCHFEPDTRDCPWLLQA